MDCRIFILPVWAYFVFPFRPHPNFYYRALVIAISATPDDLRKDRRFSYYLHEVLFDKSDLRQYSQKEMGFFSDIHDVMDTLPEGKKGALYTARISQMKHLEDLAREKGRNPISIWSMSNIEHPMSSQQEYVRERILEEEAIPSEYDLFIFNASAETAINIRSEIDFVIVNNSNRTHIKQSPRWICVYGRKLPAIAKEHQIVNRFLERAHQYILLPSL